MAQRFLFEDFYAYDMQHIYDASEINFNDCSKL